MSRVERRLWAEAGALLRGGVRRELRKAAVDLGVEVEIEEDRGFFESLFTITVRGEPERVERYQNAVVRWANEGADE